MNVMLDLPAIKKLCEAATPEPWAVERVEPDVYVMSGKTVIASMGDFYPEAEFVAHARSDLPAALDRITELEESYVGNKWTTLLRKRDAALEALEEARRLFTEYGNHHSSCILEHHAPGVRDCGCGYIVALRTILGESE